MKGRHVINVVSRKASYTLKLERKVSVIKGNSGTGKSSFIRLISEYLEYGKNSGIKIKVDSSVSLGVLTNSSEWERILDSVHDTILFIDEDVEYLYSEGFQKELWAADCYVVIVSRSGGFTGLPYSIFGIYEFVTEKKGENTTTSMYELYEKEYKDGDFCLVVTEDSNSGYEMAKYVLASDDTEVLSAGGNSSVYSMLAKAWHPNGDICVNVDGAAFGAYIEPILKYAEIKGNVMISAPESFEFVILNFSDVKKYLSSDCGELIRTYDYCEGNEYGTWEKYYEKLLMRVTADHLGFVYNKRKLNPWFLNSKCAEQYFNLICRCFVRRR